MPYLFNRGCQEENFVKLHPHLSKGAFLFSKVSLSDRSGGLLTVTLRPNPRPARLSWKRHYDHMKRKREYHIILLKKGGRTCTPCVQGRRAGNIYTHMLCIRTKPWADKWPLAPAQWGGTGRITGTAACQESITGVSQNRDEREKCMSNMWSDIWFAVIYCLLNCWLLRIALTDIRCALHLFSWGCLGGRNKELTHRPSWITQIPQTDFFTSIIQCPGQEETNARNTPALFGKWTLDTMKKLHRTKRLNRKAILHFLAARSNIFSCLFVFRFQTVNINVIIHYRTHCLSYFSC